MNTSENNIMTTKNILRIVTVVYSLWVIFCPYKGPRFMIWNLFLAWVPLEVMDSIIKINKENKTSKVIFINYILWIVWLLFYPNSPYMITDFIHIVSNKYYLAKPIHPNYAITNKILFNDNFKIWVDFVNIAIGAWLGYVVGFLSLNKAQQLSTRRYGKIISWVMVFSINMISGFAIYLGRFIRWNSWDVITNPKNIIVILVNNINRKSFNFTILFGIFTFVIYIINHAIRKDNIFIEGEENFEI
ncbi:DUF1361 domain-containing protein [Clostridium fungisolvens]|uniref:DUF1361 domain-containing protein n=1 Tax=Clostridium fungisolvens TaxID=1604897 RepID=A0A6V8SMF5_9CLOT|nr:DUF1361 domain-containing protein [Clostridium fungisolvens]GFP78409.1 hypothetical protein bsdtw1_04631 [Clostridium fungisolvens]